MSDQLKFRIVYCSSEDKDFPVTELLRHGPQSKGWQSARFQSFPQMIVFQFMSPVRVQQLQFLSHQSKITAKAELYTFLPEDLHNVPPIEFFQWKRLGYLTFDSNEASEFQARELKSVHIDVTTLFLKVILNKCHNNACNPFGQVGIVAFSVHGQELGQLPPPRSLSPQAPLLQPQQPTNLDPVTHDNVQALLLAKEQAVQREDFDEAKRLKEALDRLRGVGNTLLHLEEKKRQAILNEDYDEAKAIKQEIERLRGAVSPAQQPRPISGAREPVTRRPKMSTQSYDEQVVPAAQHTQQANASADSIHNHPGAEALLPVLGEELCTKLLSTTRQLREEGLEELRGELAKGKASSLLGEYSDEDVYAACLGAVRHTVGDKVTQVSQTAMGVLASLLNSEFSSENIVRGDCAEFAKHIILILIDKSGDHLPRVREAARTCFIELTKRGLHSTAAAVQAVLRPTKEKSPKHIMGRLSLLTAIVNEYKVDNEDVPYAPVLEFALTGYSHANQDVRNAAYYLLVTLYADVGKRIHEALDTLRPAQKDALMNGFAEVDEGTFHAPVAEQEVLPLCPFCGKRDNIFAIEDNLDIHYVKDCPMLVLCSNCRQVVEVLHLNTHLLGECELAEVMKQCGRCNEAVHIDDYDQHTEEQACVVSRPAKEANRCPLCHDDTKPGVEGWKEHILTDGCPNNDRSSY